MVDAQSQVAGIFTGLSNSFSTGGTYIAIAGILIVFLIVLAAFALFIINKKSYNIRVVIMRPMQGTKAYVKEVGLFGKHYFDKSKKELRFKIYQEKKHKIQYNGEAIDQQYLVNTKVGKTFVREVTFTPNPEGWLQPTMNVYSADTVISASVTNSDMTYYQSELEMLDSLFGNKSFFERYYLLILVVLFIICICILWYMAKQVNAAAKTNKEAVIIMSETLKYAVSMISQNNSTNLAQVVHVG